MNSLFGLSFILLIGCSLASIIHIHDENLFLLSNDDLTVQFNLSTGQINSFTYKSQLITIANETSTISIANQPVDCSKLIAYKQYGYSINFTYSCSNLTNDQLITVYTLEPQWEFVDKQILFTNNINQTVTSLQTSFAIENLVIPSVSIIQNPQDSHKQHAIFLRSNATGLGLFATWQNPFALYTVSSNNQFVRSSYQIGMNNSYLSEGFLIGFYELSSFWHTKDISYSERAAYEQTTSFFYPVPQRTQSIKHAVGWDSDDYQIDIATPQGIEEYKRLIDRCSQLGIKSITFSPSNSNVSNRANTTDDWGWESVLFLTLGQRIREQLWIPSKDPIPSTIQFFLDYAESKQVKLVPYVYPPLGYRAQGRDQAWLYPSSHCKTLCATLASVEFQQYFLELLIDFARVTGIGGYAWDYNFFYDPAHSAYSQWRGWQWIRSELLKALPNLIMDHRYASQYDGPWSWITLNGYTSPLLSDENPETYPILYPSLHTDKISADFMRRGNVELRLGHFAAMDAIPGFVGHQTERYLASGALPWYDNDIRDFDLMGFPYSLLSNIATAGLNLIHTMIPARDIEEFLLLPEEFVSFWKYWLTWSDEHIEEIRNAIPFNDERDWSLMKSNNQQGFLFLINPSYQQVNRTIIFNEKLNLRKPIQPGYQLLKEIYPQQRIIDYCDYGSALNLILDGQSVTAYEILFLTTIDQPVLIGITGEVSLDDNTLRIGGVLGEAGTQTTRPIAVILPTNITIVKVYLNGLEAKFSQTYQFINLLLPLKFPGLYLPRSAEIINNTIVISDLLIEQLQTRQRAYPIPWTVKELADATWLAPHRLLLFICILEPNDQWKLTGRINNNSIVVQKAYNTREHIDRNRFMGFYVDLSSIVTQPFVEYHVELSLPTLKPGQYQGLFLENIERILVEP